MQFKRSFIILVSLFTQVIFGQIDTKSIEQEFGLGETILKKKVSISFVYNEAAQKYFAKVSHRIDKLVLGNNEDDKGLIQVPFNEFQKLKLQKARYYKLDSIGNKTLIENVKVKYADTKDYFIKNIFYSDLKVKQFNCSVDLPENYVVSYTYDITYTDLKFLTTFYLQEVYAATQDVKISIRKNENVKLALFDFNLDDIDKTENETHIIYTGKNLKRYKPNHQSVNRSYYLPHFILSIHSVTRDKETTQILNSTDNLYHWYNSLIQELNPNQEYIQQLAKSIVGTGTTPEEKIERIFKWVQNNIQYVAFENGIAGFKPTESHKVAQLKYGDCKGMANLLVNLLQAEGFNASHAWIGTRSKNYTYNIPSLAVDNHMICGLTYKDKTYFLDGTSKSAVWSTPPPHLEGKEVLLAQGDQYQVLSIPVSNPTDNQLIINGNIDLQQEQPQISFTVELTGHFKHNYLSYIAYSNLKDRKNVPFYFIKKYLDGIKVNTISEPLISEDKITYTVSGLYMNCAKSDAKTTVFPFLSIFEYNPILEQAPPVYVNYPKSVEVTLEVKHGNKLPKEIYNKELLGNDAFNAVYYTEKKDEGFFIRQQLNLNLLNTSKEQQEDWNSFYNKTRAFNTIPLGYE